MKNQKITIYVAGEFFGSINKHEGKLIEFGKRDYAQYRDCDFVTFIPAGKRKPVMLIAKYKPYLVVLSGHGHPAAPGMFSEPQISAGLTTRVSKYSSFDDRYKTDMDQILDPLIKSQPEAVLIDNRFTKAA